MRVVSTCSCGNALGFTTTGVGVNPPDIVAAVVNVQDSGARFCGLRRWKPSTKHGTRHPQCTPSAPTPPLVSRSRPTHLHFVFGAVESSEKPLNETLKDVCPSGISATQPDNLETKTFFSERIGAQPISPPSQLRWFDAGGVNSQSKLAKTSHQLRRILSCHSGTNS